MTDAPARRPQPPKSAFWNDPRVRALFFQALVLIAVVAVAAYMVNNTLANLEKRGIASGFKFFGETAGFGIAMNLIEYSDTSTYGRAFLVGLLNTLLVASLGIVAATILGFLIGVARLSKNWLVAKLSAAYVEIARNLPLLLQIFFWYFAVLGGMPSPRQSVSFMDAFFINNRGLFSPSPVLKPGFGAIPIAFGIAVVAVFFLARWAKRRQELTGQPFHTVYASLGILLGLPLLAAVVTGFPLSWSVPKLQGFNFAGGMVLIPELVSLWLALTIYTAAFIGEAVRAGILAVDRGQTEAAMAAGLTRAQTLRFVVIPQAMRVIVPPMTNQYLSLTKNSSLAAAIAYPDLTAVFAGTVLNQTGQAVEVIAVTMAVYLAISLSISLVMNVYNKSVALVER